MSAMPYIEELEWAWSLIANARDWLITDDELSKPWIEAACRWRDEVYHPALEGNKQLPERPVSLRVSSEATRGRFTAQQMKVGREEFERRTAGLREYAYSDAHPVLTRSIQWEVAYIDSVFADLEQLRQHLRGVRKAIGDINGARAQDEAALDSLALDLDEYIAESSGL